MADVDAFLHIWLQESAQVRYTPHLLAWTDGGVRFPPGILFPAWPFPWTVGAEACQTCGSRSCLRQTTHGDCRLHQLFQGFCSLSSSAAGHAPSAALRYNK